MSKYKVTVSAIVESTNEDEAVNHFCDTFCDGCFNDQITVVKVDDNTRVTSEDE